MQSGNCKVSTELHSVRVYHLKSDSYTKVQADRNKLPQPANLFTGSVHPKECELFSSNTT